jgi:hypothetical protein
MLKIQYGLSTITPVQSELDEYKYFTLKIILVIV